MEKSHPSTNTATSNGKRKPEVGRLVIVNKNGLHLFSLPDVDGPISDNELPAKLETKHPN